jgi:hypothetical protein
MKTSKRIAFFAAACTLLVAVMSVMSPKAVRAAVATFVLDVDNPARHPVTANCASDSEGLCTIVVPTNYTLVIDRIVLTGSYSSTTPPALELAVQSASPGLPGSGITSASFTSAYSIPTIPDANNPGNSWVFFSTVNTSQYATAGGVSFHIENRATSGTAINFVVNMQGHVVALQ